MSSFPSLADTARLLGRAVRLRCPNCGEGHIFAGWFRQKDRCPQCHLVFNRGEQGYVVGAYMFNIIVAELVFAAIFVSVLLSTWPDPPWTLLTYGGAALMVILPVLFYPFSRTLFLAFDLLFRPELTGQGASWKGEK
jgi:uncharacterized protein (DUF983 family)